MSQQQSERLRDALVEVLVKGLDQLKGISGKPLQGVLNHFEAAGISLPLTKDSARPELRTSLEAGNFSHYVDVISLQKLRRLRKPEWEEAIIALTDRGKMDRLLPWMASNLSNFFLDLDSHVHISTDREYTSVCWLPKERPNDRDYLAIRLSMPEKVMRWNLVVFQAPRDASLSRF